MNVVSGSKTFNRLGIANLLITGDVKIQDVDVLQWIRHGVLTNGTFRISRNKQFRNITLPNGLR